jgi:hypothetical protein
MYSIHNWGGMVWYGMVWYGMAEGDLPITRGIVLCIYKQIFLKTGANFIDILDNSISSTFCKLFSPVAQ